MFGSFQRPQTEALDGGKDVVGGFVPAEGLRVCVDGVDVVLDGVLEFLGRAMNPAAELFVGQEREEALDLIEPGGAGGREVDMRAGGGAPANAGRRASCVWRSCVA